MKATLHMRSASPIGFRRPMLITMGFSAALGAAFLVISLAFHSQVPSRYLQENARQTQPHHVLVVVRGTPENPSYVGFLAVVKPNSNILTVIPIKGTSLTVQAGKKVPLWKAVSTSSTVGAVALIEQAAHIQVGHYFLMRARDLQTVLTALYSSSKGWPKTETVSAMLATLGYPQGHLRPGRELLLLRSIVHGLPQLNPLVASTLLSIAKSSRTNLSPYQLFQLANYVRGDTFRLGPGSTRRGRRGQ